MAAPSAKGDWARSAGSNLAQLADWDGSDRNNPPKWRDRESRFISNSVVSPSPLFTYNPQVYALLNLGLATEYLRRPAARPILQKILRE